MPSTKPAMTEIRYAPTGQANPGVSTRLGLGEQVTFPTRMLVTRQRPEVDGTARYALHVRSGCGSDDGGLGWVFTFVGSLPEFVGRTTSWVYGVPTLRVDESGRGVCSRLVGVRPAAALNL